MDWDTEVDRVKLFPKDNQKVNCRLQLEFYLLYFLGQDLAAVLALVPLVVIKVYGRFQEASERQEQEKKKGLQSGWRGVVRV